MMNSKQLSPGVSGNPTGRRVLFAPDAMQPIRTRGGFSEPLTSRNVFPVSISLQLRQQTAAR